MVITDQFLLRGINIKVPKTWPSGVHVLNNDGPVPWLLLAIVPTKDLIVAADGFLSQSLHGPFYFYWGLFRKNMASHQPI